MSSAENRLTVFAKPQPGTVSNVIAPHPILTGDGIGGDGWQRDTESNCEYDGLQHVLHVQDSWLIFAVE